MDVPVLEGGRGLPLASLCFLSAVRGCSVPARGCHYDTLLSMTFQSQFLEERLAVRESVCDSLGSGAHLRCAFPTHQSSAP